MDESKQWIYRLHLNRFEMLAEGPTPEEAQALSDHWQHLLALKEQGKLILAGRTQVTEEERLFGIVVFTADSEAEARQIMENDPAVKHNVQRATLYPYKVALMGEATLIDA